MVQAHFLVWYSAQGFSWPWGHKKMHFHYRSASTADYSAALLNLNSMGSPVISLITPWSYTTKMIAYCTRAFIFIGIWEEMLKEVCRTLSVTEQNIYMWILLFTRIHVYLYDKIIIFSFTVLNWCGIRELQALAVVNGILFIHLGYGV